MPEHVVLRTRPDGESLRWSDEPAEALVNLGI